MPKATPRKRPCKICRRWFLPNARLKDRQKTCADTACQKEWHRRQCAKWNKRNPEYFKADYLEKKLKKTTQTSSDKRPAKEHIPKSRIKLGLPLDVIQDVINQKPLVIIDYFVEQLVRRYQAAIQVQLAVNTSKRPTRAP
jgi:hypothetical protein